MEHVLIIGANGAIAQAIIKQLCDKQTALTLHCVSRSVLIQNYSNQHNYQIDSSQETQIQAFTDRLKKQGIRLSLVIGTTGVLHSDGSNVDSGLKPEKRLEDINYGQLSEYFKVNTIVPALWLKGLVSVMDRKQARIVFFSARVGSISENRLGGWYGYRASKAALNMIVKTASVEYKRRSPNTCLACYHPGTVDTKLSKPFQANVKPEKLFTAEFTATQLLTHVESFHADNSPYYIDWDNKTIEY